MDTKMRSKIALLFASFFMAGVTAAADFQSLVRETQRTANEGQQMTMAWWIPVEFWDESLKTNPNVTDAMRARFTEILGEYQMFVVTRAKSGIAGITDVQSKDELVKNAQFIIDGKVLEPIDPDQINPQAQTVMAAMKPALAGMLGPLGQSMQFVVYPAKRDGKRIIDPIQKGGFDYKLFEQTFHWRLPLASLLPKKIDPNSGEEFPGDYLFNPYTGKPLNGK